MVGPNYGRPPIERPSAFKSPVPAGASGDVPQEWWRLYRDAELDRLIASANDSNQTLRQAIAAFDQARALARVAASFRYPTIVANAAYTRARTSASRVSPITGVLVSGTVPYSDWLIPLDLTYEVDVWGRVRRSVEGARATARASEDDEAVVRLTVQSDVAQFYYMLRGFDTQASILTQTVVAYREQVRVLSVQVSTGLASPLVLNQAQAQLQSTLAQEADVARARADEEHALAILCGRPASSFAIAPNPLHEVVPPAVPPGLPATLLIRRPDVAAAEQRLVAANAQIGVATADLRPQFTLTGAAGFESELIDSIFEWQSALWSIVAGMSAPIFEGGRLKANLEASKAQYRQFLAAYTNQVLVAYGDVEDALTDLHALTVEVADLRDAVVASDEYLRRAEAQYRSGLVDYLTVIDAERTLLGNQIALAQSLTTQMNASVHLMKALGGGWPG
jgi:outer membrane protein, multidrug efflux system